MAFSSFGHIFKLTTFGESHGIAVGGVVDGCPSNLEFDLSFVQEKLDNRRPGQSAITTQRKELDTVEILSGVFQGKTTGAPIGFIIRNKDQQSKDYEHLKDVYRPSHADFVYEKKYGNRDYRGGGRASARETACRVVAGAIAQLYLQQKGISFHGFVSSIGKISLQAPLNQFDLSQTFKSLVRCPDAKTSTQMIAAVEQAKAEGDSLGGMVSCLIKGLPVGLGEPIYRKFHAELGYAMLSINAVKGVEFGSGFEGTTQKGSEHNDVWQVDEEGSFVTKTNNSGGIQAGITNGQSVYFRVAFKPTSTIMQSQQTVTKGGKDVTLDGKGRHDPCVVPRAVPVVEAMAAMVTLDAWLQHKARKD